LPCEGARSSTLRSLERPESFDQLDALRQIGEFASAPHYVDTPVQQIIAGTLARMHETLRAISHLVPSDMPTQAAMLTRPLFEDMVVSHWLADQNDPSFLVERFLAHRDAIALLRRRLANEHAWAIGVDPVDEVDVLVRQEQRLVAEFGPAANRDWWARDAEGKRVGLNDVVKRLEASKRFVPRFSGGEENLLVRWHRVVQKWSTQYLHHTAMGLPLAVRSDGPPGEFEDPLLPFWVCFSSFWTFGQQVYLILAFDGEEPDYFDELFVPLLHSAFVEPMKDLTSELP
jgi:Family of unknown function (DUF5677)